jgi:hypothetical protein
MKSILSVSSCGFVDEISFQARVICNRVTEAGAKL